METDKSSRQDLLTEAAKASNDARLFRLAAPMVNNDEKEESLRRRADELDAVAANLRAEAGKLAP